MEGDHLYGGTDTHGCFAIYLYFLNPCFRVLMAWDKYEYHENRDMVIGPRSGAPGLSLLARSVVFFFCLSQWRLEYPHNMLVIIFLSPSPKEGTRGILA